MKSLLKAAICVSLFTSATFLLAASDQKDKKTSGGSKVVDSGSFGIFINGKRVGTETFHIEQRADVNVATSEIRVEDAKGRAVQSAEMQISPRGELRSYTWRATSPVKEEASVEPKDELLIEHLVPADQKKIDFPHVLPISTVILDDNFFSQREILVWRYLATGCLHKEGEISCGPSHFGVLVPHQHLASDAVVELLGRDKILVKGVEREVNKLKLETEGVQWFLWVSDPEDQYKLLKMTVPANNVEVVRD